MKRFIFSLLIAIIVIGNNGIATLIDFENTKATECKAELYLNEFGIMDLRYICNPVGVNPADLPSDIDIEGEFIHGVAEKKDAPPLHHRGYPHSGENYISPTGFPDHENIELIFDPPVLKVSLYATVGPMCEGKLLLKPYDKDETLIWGSGMNSLGIPYDSPRVNGSELATSLNILTPGVWKLFETETADSSAKIAKVILEYEGDDKVNLCIDDIEYTRYLKTDLEYKKPGLNISEVISQAEVIAIQ